MPPADPLCPMITALLPGPPRAHGIAGALRSASERSTTAPWAQCCLTLLASPPWLHRPLLLYRRFLTLQDHRPAAAALGTRDRGCRRSFLFGGRVWAEPGKSGVCLWPGARHAHCTPSPERALSPTRHTNAASADATTLFFLSSAPSRSSFAETFAFLLRPSGLYLTVDSIEFGTHAGRPARLVVS